MKLRLIFLSLIYFTGLQAVLAEDYTLSMLIDSLDDNIHFVKTEALSQMGQYDYKVARASLYPSISGSVPFSLSSIDEEEYTPGIDNQKSQALTAAPEISISQLLPTAGILTAQISDSVSMSKIIESSLTGFSTDADWTNSVDISLNLTQPVFFKGAFDAALEIINKTYENSNLTALTARNSMVLIAIESYYNLKQAIFNLELIQIRFMKDKENYKRINQEFEMGLWTKSNLYQARSILIKSETDLLEAEQTMDTARQSIIANYSLPGKFNVSSVVDSMDFKEMDFNGISEKVITANPAINHIRNLLNMQRASLAILRKENGPVLSLGGSYSYLTDIDDLDSNRNVFSLSLGLSGNLFDGGKDNAAMVSGKALLKQLESDLSKVILDLELQIKTLMDSISRSSKLIELYNFQEEAAQYEYEKGKKDLELGQITEKELSELHINLENTRISKQQNIINKNMFYLRLADLQGVDLLHHPIFRNNE